MTYSPTRLSQDIYRQGQSGSAAASVLQLQNVSLRYNDDDEERSVLALDGVSLTVQEKEFLVIVGPSGCGKSTLLKILVGLLEPSLGNVLHYGKQITGTIDNVGMVYQSPLLLPWRNVFDNVILPAEVVGRDQERYVENATQLLEMVGLSEFRKAMPSQLSGGMQQRVALCRALVTDPRLLLMDEPFAALDALTRDEMAQELARLWQRRKKTVVFVTHGISEAVLLADRVIVMSPRPGRIIEELVIDLPRPREEARKQGSGFSDYVEKIRDFIFSFKQK